MLRHLDRLPEPRDLLLTPVTSRQGQGVAVRRRRGFIDQAERGDADVGAGETGIDALHAQHRSRPSLDADLRSGRVDPWQWCDSLTTDYWNPPSTASQHAHQRVLAIILGFALAAILAQLGW